MHPQLVLAAEALAAEGAGEGVAAGPRGDAGAGPVQPLRPPEGDVAPAAAGHLLPVRPLMPPQASQLHEAPVALQAAEGPLAGVVQPVHSELPPLAEALQALGAAEGARPRVLALVHSELAPLAGTLAAVAAAVGPLPPCAGARVPSGSRTC